MCSLNKRTYQEKLKKINDLFYAYKISPSERMKRIKQLEKEREDLNV